MQFIIQIVVTLVISSLFSVSDYIKNKIFLSYSQQKSIEKIQNYRMDQLHNSTLSEKYGVNYDYPGETIIEFNNCKYKIIDNKSGGRKFEPEGNCPPLVLTPISYEKYLSLLSSTPTITSDKSNNQNNAKLSNFNNVNKNTNKNNQNIINNNNINNSNLNNNQEYIRCHFPHSGVLYLKKEECEKLIDCQINDNIWTPLTKEECDKKQKENYQLYLQKNYVSVYLPHSEETINCLSDVKESIYNSSKILLNMKETQNKISEMNKESKQKCIEDCKVSLGIIQNYDYTGCISQCFKLFDDNFSSYLNRYNTELDYLNKLIQIGQCRK